MLWDEEVRGVEENEEEEGGGGETVRVPPTICFTWPAWMSMQARKRVIVFSWRRRVLWEAEGEEMGKQVRGDGSGIARRLKSLRTR